VQVQGGDLATGIETLKEARALNEATKNPRRGSSMIYLGIAQLRSGSVPDALATLAAARGLLAAPNSGGDAAATSWALAAYGAAVAAGGDVAEGERLARKARDDLKASTRATSVRLGDIDQLLADVLDQAARHDEARTIRQEGVEAYRRVLGEAHPRTRALLAQIDAAPAQ
jgi:serine/threonine-protein kinase